MAIEVSHSESVCEDCHTKWTDENEWVMDVFMCYYQQEYCLNCCGCDEHDGEPWYRPAKDS